MKPVKPIKTLSLMLVASMLLSAAACSKNTATKEKKGTTTTSNTETEKEKDSEASDSATSESNTEPETSETSEKVTAPKDQTYKGNLNIEVPAENCSIEFPDEELFHYFMDLELDPDNRTIGGHVDVTFFNTSEEDWDKLCLRDYSSLFTDNKLVGYDGALDLNGEMTTIENITDGRSKSTLEYTRDEDISVVWIDLPEVLKAGETMTLSYDFVATIPTVADRYGVEEDVFCVSNFFPVLAVYTDEGWSHEAYYEVGECFFTEIADFDVELTVPEEVIMLSTGVEKQITPHDGKTTYSIEAPCVRTFVFCASKNFQILEDDYNGTHIRVAYDPASSENEHAMEYEAEASLQAAIDSLAAFGAALGEYPYADLEVILAPIAAGGMEYPNLVIITALAVDKYEPENSVQGYAKNIADSVVSHEIGHQWFMGIVGNNSGLEPWLDESFASYTEKIYIDYIGSGSYSTGPVMLDPQIQASFLDDAYVKMSKDGGTLPINRSYYDFDQQFQYIQAVYNLGKVALTDMEEILGQEDFYGILREYIQRNAFTNSTEDRFFEVLYECAGTDNEDLNKVIEVVFGR